MEFGRETTNHKPQEIHVCPHEGCNCQEVQPTYWPDYKKLEDYSYQGLFYLELRCPDCEQDWPGTFTRDEMKAYDEKLIDDECAMEDALFEAERIRFEEVIGSFAIALNNNLIGPDDFKTQQKY